MATEARVRVRIDKRVLEEQLRGRQGEVGKVIAGFAGQATKEIKDVFRQRAGGPWWPVHSSIQQGANGTHLITTVKASRPHRITAKNAPMLVFFWEREGRMFYGKSVNHPGSSPPVELILSGVERAGRRLRFTRAAPSVT